MQYTKPPLTFEQQADQLLARGMVGDRAAMIEHSLLSFVKYCRVRRHRHVHTNRQAANASSNGSSGYGWDEQPFRP